MPESLAPAPRQPDTRHLLILQQPFPPLGPAGGAIRTVKFMKYLHRLGWRFVVVTLDPARTITATPQNSGVLLPEIPADTRVVRVGPSFAFPQWSHYRPQTAPANSPVQTGPAAPSRRGWLRGLLRRGLRGLLLPLKRGLLLPDEGVLWVLPGLLAALGVLRGQPIDAIFVTTPAHSTGLIGWLLSFFTRTPLLLEMRDDWLGTAAHQQKSRLARWLERQMERQIVQRASHVLTVTDASLHALRARYPHQPAGKFSVIPNGTDLQEFDGLALPPPQPDAPFRIACANSGIEPGYRDARPFFQALAQFLARTPQARGKVRVTFLGHAISPAYAPLLAELGLADVVETRFPTDRPEFIRQIQQADLLLSVQVPGFPTSISGTLYEYWAVGRAPILLISEPGASFALVRDQRLGGAFPPTDTDPIRAYLARAFAQWQAGTPLRISRAGVEQFDRRALAGRLHQLLVRCVASQPQEAADA